MRGAVIVLLILLLALPSLTDERGMVTIPHPVQTQGQDQGNVSVELDVYPDPGSWVNTPGVVISARVINESFTPRLDLSLITLDGVRLIPLWDQANLTVWAASKDSLPDGAHEASVELINVAHESLNAVWSFGIDSVPPLVDLEPLPEVADVRVFPVRGAVDDPNLRELSVNGVLALVTNGTFVAHILLWPGNNDITVQAFDQADNLGLAVDNMRWLPPEPPDQAFDTYLYENGSFSVSFPATWDVHQDYELDDSTVADLVALKTTGPYQSSIAIVSQRTADVVTEGLLLSILQNSILKLEGGLELDVVSRPQIIDLLPGSTEAQFSVVQRLQEGSRALIVVTSVWDSQVGRLWLIVGSIPVERIEEDWYAVNMALDTFDVIEPPSPPKPPPEPPTASIDRSLAVTVGTIALILILFSATLYRRRRIARKPPHL